MEEFNYDKDKGADRFQFANQSEHVANSKSVSAAAAAGERSHLLLAEPPTFRYWAPINQHHSTLVLRLLSYVADPECLKHE